MTKSGHGATIGKKNVSIKETVIQTVLNVHLSFESIFKQ